MENLANREFKIGKVKCSMGIGVMFGIAAAIGPDGAVLCIGPFYLFMDW